MSFFETNKYVTRREFLQKSTVVGASFILSENSKIMRNSPNILWIMTDDQRVDSLHCYGSSWAKSPNVDALAVSGVLFRNAISQSPVCAPSRTSMLSGKYCRSVGLMANRGKVKEGTYPLTRKFSENGYQLTNIGKLGSSMPGYKIFDNTIDSPGYGGPAASPFELINEFKGKEKEFGVIKLPDFVIISGTYPLPEERTEHAITTTNAIDFIENRLREPFFLRVSMISPHTPVMPPKPYDTMFDPDEIPLPLPTEEELKSKPEFERIKLMQFSGSAGRITNKEVKKAWASYYGLTASVDHQVGRLLEVMKKNNLIDNTIVIFTSDQGVQMGEHGIFMKRNFYEQTVLSPLILSWPGHIPDGKVIDTQVELVDLLPTLLELVNIPQEKGIHGKSLLPLITGKTYKLREETFSEIDHSSSQYPFLTEGTGRRVMIRTEEWKLIYFVDKTNPDGALYNLQEDPGEVKNLYYSPKYKEIIKKLEAIVTDWNAST